MVWERLSADNVRVTFSEKKIGSLNPASSLESLLLGQERALRSIDLATGIKG